MTEYKQLIIARRDLDMSPGKLAAQVAHGSIAWMLQELKSHAKMTYDPIVDTKTRKVIGRTNLHVLYEYAFDSYDFSSLELYNWISEAQTKIVCGARNKNHLLKAKKIAEELGLVENEHFFLIYDLCRTELESEESDGRTLTVIGFIPLDEKITHEISKHYQLY